MLYVGIAVLSRFVGASYEREKLRRFVGASYEREKLRSLCIGIGTAVSLESYAAKQMPQTPEVYRNKCLHLTENCLARVKYTFKKLA